MPAIGTTVKVLLVIPMLLLMPACDIEEKETKYNVTIYVSDNIIGQVKTGKAKRFKKPRVEVHAPEGVEVEHEEREPEEVKVINFVSISWLLLLAGFLTTPLLRSSNNRRNYASEISFFPPSAPTYQRG